MSRVYSNALFLPAFPDGELVSHFLRRLCHGARALSVPPASKRLVGRRPELSAMPNDLVRFHREVGHFYGSIASLVDRHTLCDLHCCGLPMDRFTLQRARLEKKLFTATRLNHLPVDMTPPQLVRLRCTDCEKEQERDYGFAFIHRRTEVPFVEVCGTHGIALRSEVGEAGPYELCRRCVPDLYQREMALEYSRRICVAVETPVAQSPYHKDAVAERLLAAGWASPARRLHFDDLIPQFSFFFRNAFSDGRLALLVEHPLYIEAAVRAIFRCDRNVHPVWCVLFLWFAESCSLQRRVTRKRSPYLA